MAIRRLSDKLLLLNQIHLGGQKARADSASEPTYTKPLNTKLITISQLNNCFPEVLLWPEIHRDPQRFNLPPSDAKRWEDVFTAQCLSESGCLRIRRPLIQLWNSGIAFNNLFHESFQNKQDCYSALGLMSHPSKWCFLDLETCGLSGSPLFLIGCLYYQEGEWIVDQIFARHYGEEETALECFWKGFPRFDSLITFNGKSFDWPFLCERSYVHGIQPLSEPFHLDVLQLGRKKWKSSLPNCKLQTLEQAFCRREREGDLSGAEIPNAYHQFVEDGCLTSMTAALHHNALDLITMLELILVCATEGLCIGKY